MVEKLQLKRITVPAIRARKVSWSSGATGGGIRISAVTAYDYTSAMLVDQAGVDLILVGDSLSSVIQGHKTTIPVTLEQMIYHCSCVSRGVCRALLVGDMPFLSYQISVSSAIESAGRLIKEGGVSAVKMEGGVNIAETVARIVNLDIPVVGHVGLTPQSYHRMGGHKLQGITHESKDQIVADALAIEAAGAFAIVLEGIPDTLAGEISEQLTIPTIGIGAGPQCDGQILVLNDLLGLTVWQPPSFTKQYANLSEIVVEAVRTFAGEVRKGDFPKPRSGPNKKANTKKLRILK